MNKKLNLILSVMSLIILTNCKKGEEDPSISFSSRKARLVGVWNMESFETVTTYKNIYQATNPDNDFEVLSRDGETSEVYNSTTKTHVEKYNEVNETSTSNTSNEFSTSGSTYTEKFTYNDGSTLVTETEQGAYVFEVSESWDIKKDGTFSRTVISKRMKTFTDVTDPDLTKIKSFETSENKVFEGTWAFIGSNSNGEFKNKERIGFWISKITGSETTNVIDQNIDNSPSLFIDLSYKDQDETITTVNENLSLMEPQIVWELNMLRNDELNIIYSSSYNDKSSEKHTNYYTDKDGTTTNSTTTVRDYTETTTGSMVLKIE